jgi:hypothetical protein
MDTPEKFLNRLRTGRRQPRLYAHLFTMAALLAVFAGCATEQVLLRHPQTSEIAKCGPFSAPTVADRVEGIKRTRECVEEYERQGYRRIL